ncbi:hypothetical protein TNCV_1987141 [Trichonephila clavipes]|nr:hypothetical protein TNCV_1987141 [Trichonephila clavipes]
MDEVPLSFDIPPTRTVDVQGARLFATKTAADYTPLRIIYRKIRQKGTVVAFPTSTPQVWVLFPGWARLTQPYIRTAVDR